LSGAASAEVEERKVRLYLLNPRSVAGASKAAFFIARGFEPRDWRRFAVACIQHATTHEVVAIRPSRFGALHEVRCALQTPDGSNPCIRIVWQVRPDRPPRLITAYPF